MIIDFHSHILPGVDDGSRSVAESLQMLSVMADQGVDYVVATPHFYPNRTSAEEFFSKRAAAIRALATAAGRIPAIRYGAEMGFFNGMGNSDVLRRICITNTNLLLIEMPFRNWTERDVEELVQVIGRGITPILAHVERFYPYQHDLRPFQEVMQLPVYVQMNAGAVACRKDRRVVSKVISYGRPVLLGSDCHNLTSRIPNLQEGRNALQKKYGVSFLVKMDSLGERLLGVDHCFIE